MLECNIQPHSTEVHNRERTQKKISIHTFKSLLEDQICIPFMAKCKLATRTETIKDTDDHECEGILWQHIMYKKKVQVGQRMYSVLDMATADCRAGLPGPPCAQLVRRQVLAGLSPSGHPSSVTVVVPEEDERESLGENCFPRVSMEAQLQVVLAPRHVVRTAGLD